MRGVNDLSKWENRFNNKREPLCPVPNCVQICEKFKNGNWRKYCDLHNSYSLFREKWWGLFKTRILIRDNHTCCWCGNKNNLHVDHIIALMNGGKEFDENNTRVLCEKCHKKKTKQDWKDFKKRVSK